jgi:hypothetical protein
LYSFFILPHKQIIPLMKKICIVFCALAIISCGSGSTESGSGSEPASTEESSSSSDKPTKEIIEASLHKQYDIKGSPTTPGYSVEVHSIKIGATEGTDEQDRIDGIPEASSVTMAKVEYTRRTYYTDATKAYRETGTFKVYKDAFGEWIAMLDGTEGTRYFDEPAVAQ